MTDSELITRSLIGGTVNAAILVVIAFLLSRFVRDGAGRGLLVIFLFTAAGAYVGFAIGTGAPPGWALVELLHVVAFGTLGLLGWRGSPYWLAAGWALHPVWDFGLHYAGPGHSFTPVVWAISCIPFDLLVAAYVVLAYRFLGARRMRFRVATAPHANIVGAPA